jgi:4'-phosphopantetheinyl transferase
MKVEIWTIALDLGEAARARLHRWLSSEEQARAARFRHGSDRRRHIVSHGAVRAILAEALGCDPWLIRFESGPMGKPALPVGQDGGIRFNLAHSAELAVCAVTDGVEVGVDVEARRDVPDAEAILRGNFAPCEVEDWLRLPPGRQIEAFLRLWTCKEAWLKACGLGLSLPISQSEITLSGNTASFRSVNGSRPEAGRWTLRTFEPAPGYVGAVCVEAANVDFRWRDWQTPA